MGKIVVIIPARLKSTRLPNKALIDLCGKTLIQRVYEGAAQSKLADEIIIATDSEKIVAEIERIGGKAIMTPSELPTGTDRVAYVAKDMDCDIIVNVQGDQPEVSGDFVDTLITALKNNPQADVSTLQVPFETQEEIQNPNNVKVISDRNGFSLYFSRSVIPYAQNKIEGFTYYWHLGYYAYTKEFVQKYTQLKQTPLEKMESLEQLRILENGFKIVTATVKRRTFEINVPEDVKKFEEAYNGV